LDAFKQASEIEGQMPRFYFHVQNSHDFVRDEEGIDLADEAAARAMAMDSIRSMIAEEVRKGVIDLDGFIEVLDHGAVQLTKIDFPEAFTIRFPADNARE
jgi:hypothetical protein